MMNIRFLAACCSALLFLGGSTARAAVTVTGGNTFAIVYDSATGSGDQELISGASDAAANASLDGFLGLAERVTSGAAITHNFEQLRQGAYQSSNSSDYSEGYVYTVFEVDVDTPYSLSGSFTNSAAHTFMYTYLVDLSAAQEVFANQLRNTSDSPYSAIVGNQDGNFYSYLAGNASGVFLAGHEYGFYTSAYTQAYPDADVGATASGSFTLQFGDPDVEIVPEPASIAVWSCLGLGAIGMTWVRRRKAA
jgi:hypothetical protein